MKICEKYVIGVDGSMALKPLRECKVIGCHKLTRNTYCEEHKDMAVANEKARQKYYDEHLRNKKTKAHYQSKEHRLWANEVKRKAKGLCQCCSTVDAPVVGTDADHIIPIDTPKGWNRRLDINNGQLLCHKCHMIKTANDREKYKDYYMLGRGHT